jgi:hypothetical protein
VDEQRAWEVSAAISRYEKAGLPIPEEWEEEIRYLQGRAIQGVVRQDKESLDSIKEMLRRAVIYKEKRAVCVDDCGGDCRLTEGKEYGIVVIGGGLVRVINDAGEEREYFMERFR